jgi:hypothetical protein
MHMTKRGVGTTPLDVAISRVRKIDAELVTQMVNSLVTTLSTMRTNGASLSETCEFERAVLVASFIEREGVVTGLGRKIESADLAVVAIKERIRANANQRTLLYGEEITSFDDFVYWHGYQLKEISCGEYARVLQRAAGRMDAKLQARINGALRDGK